MGRNINIEFPIYNADGTPFNNLVIKKSTYESTVMGLGDKITGEVCYKDNTLAVTMSEYIEFKRSDKDDAVRFILVNPPTIVRDGTSSNGGDLKGMTKYSFEFYHPMCQLANYPFSDVAVSSDENKYLAESKTFSWAGKGIDFIAKINKNLEGTQWVVVASSESLKKLNLQPDEVVHSKSKNNKDNNVLTFDKTFIADVLKTTYETWEVPFVIDSLKRGEYTYKNKNNETIDYYDEGKRFVILFGYPSNEIYDCKQIVATTSESHNGLFYDPTSISLKSGQVLAFKNVDTEHASPYLLNSSKVPISFDTETMKYTASQDVEVYVGSNVQNAALNVWYGDNVDNPFVFKFGQGMGLKNNSRTPKNNKIVTRIVGYGSEKNIPYGYPQIRWYGNSEWKYTEYEDDDPTKAPKPTALLIYEGILNGQNVKLIKHPFTRKELMPTIYRETLFNKVSPYDANGNPNANYDPDTTLIDYIDADNSFVNPVDVSNPSVEIHQFEDIKPEFTNHKIISAYCDASILPAWESLEVFESGFINPSITSASEHGWASDAEILNQLYEEISPFPEGKVVYLSSKGATNIEATAKGVVESGNFFVHVSYKSEHFNYSKNVWIEDQGEPTVDWDDSTNADGEYVQDRFVIKIPQLRFDIYACASITEEMKINMRDGACIGCTFDVLVDWEDYKLNFFKEENGKSVFDPVIHTTDGDGHVRDGAKYPDSSQGQIALTVKKDLETFGVLMPNAYQKPKGGDPFVILGISLPESYILNAENRLDTASVQYMRENNVYYYDYPLKFDEYFLTNRPLILSQIKNNSIVRFRYGNEQTSLFIKQMSIKYGFSPLPQYDITLSDDIEIVLNKIGQVTDDVSRMSVQLSEIQKYYSQNFINELNTKLSKVANDVCQGLITFQQGLESIGNMIVHESIGSPRFSTGILTGSGWQIDKVGNAELESLRVRTYLEVVELLINRVQAQEGDTAFTDNDQIERVDKIRYGGIDYYLLSLKEKWSGYITSQQEGNVIRGVINTLAAKESGMSNVEDTPDTEHDGRNSYYTSWMRCVSVPNGMDLELGNNQILTILYGKNDIPADKNFPPCELMTIVRWGCIKNPNEKGITAGEKESRRRRQNSFYISTTEGRIMRLVGVNKPILNEGNFGSTLGELPDFVKNYTSVSPLIANGGDFLYAQGIVVENFIKIDKTGTAVVNYVDKGDWQTNTVYLVNEYNENTGQYETHDVWHNDSYWRCQEHQPVNGIYYEPTETSPYWDKLLRSGEDPVVYEIETSSSVINADANGNVSTGNIEVLAYKTTGNVRSENLLGLTSQYYAEYSIDGGTWESCANIRISISEIIYGIPAIRVRTTTSEISIRLKHTSDTSKVLKDNFKIQVVKDGAQGGRGKIGRFFYYAQEWVDTSEVSYLVSDAQAPYFLYSGNYWVFNPSVNDTYTLHEMGEPSNSNQDWQIMVSDFAYIITKAIFGEYAQFGSAIISGDWMLSTNGVIDGIPYNNGALYNNAPAYTWFNPSYPNVSHPEGGNFIPNYCVNLLTGATYQQQAWINGTIYAKNLYIESTFLMNSDKKVYGLYNVDQWKDDVDLYRGRLADDDINYLLGFNKGDIVGLETNTRLFGLLYEMQYAQGDAIYEGHGWELCTGSCQKVFYYGNTTGNNIYIPDPKVYKSKSIEIYNETENPCTVKCIDDGDLSYKDTDSHGCAFVRLAVGFGGVSVNFGEIVASQEQTYSSLTIPAKKKMTILSIQIYLNNAQEEKNHHYLWGAIETSPIFE